jgi:hypothetical protein
MLFCPIYLHEYITYNSRITLIQYVTSDVFHTFCLWPSDRRCVEHITHSQCYFSLKQSSGMHSDTKFGWRGGMSVILMPGKKVPEHHSSLRLCEKELLEWCSNAFCHKNNPAYSHMCIYFWLSHISAAFIIVCFWLTLTCLRFFFQDGVMRFNGQLADLFLLKLKIEAAIGQETLKMNRFMYMVHKRLFRNLKEKKLK